MDPNPCRPPDRAAEADGDQDDLRLLARLHNALAAATGLFGLIAAPFLWAGSRAMKQLSPDDAEAYIAGLVVLAFGILWAAVCLVHASVLVYIGRLIRSCRRWWLVMIFSGLHLVNVPLGTALSIYTFMVLRRKSVQARFNARSTRETRR